MVLQVQTETLQSASGDLYEAAGTVAEKASQLTWLGDPADPDVKAGLDAMTVAWSAVLDVLAKDVNHLAGRTGWAGSLYDVRDNGLANGINGGRPR